MSEKLSVAIIGCGEFAQNFVPLFKLHPYVEKVFCCDIIKERAEKYSEKFDIEILKSFNHIKNIKYLNKFSNNVQNLHTEHYKTLLVEIKESLSK